MPPAKKASSADTRTGIIRSVSTPLGFYVLSLLIVEAALGLVLTASKLNEDHVWLGFLVAIGLFLIVLAVVTALVIWNTTILLYGKEEYSSPALDPSALKDAIEDIIAARVKPECLTKPSNGMG
jgi:heme A synthase